MHSPFSRDMTMKDKKNISIAPCFVYLFLILLQNIMSTPPEQAIKPSGEWSQLLLNKVVLVTGAAGAIGSAIVEACVIHGARVVIGDVDKKSADEVAQKIINDDESKKDYVIAVSLDVTNEEEIQKVVNSVVDKWNTIDILVNKYHDYIIESFCFMSDCVHLVQRILHLVQLKMFQPTLGQRS